MASKPAKFLFSLFLPLMTTPDPPPPDFTFSPPPDNIDTAQPGQAPPPDLPQQDFTFSPPPDIESEGPQPQPQPAPAQLLDPPRRDFTLESDAAQPKPAAAQLPDPPPWSPTFSGLLVTLCFTSALESLLFFLQLQDQRRLPISYHLFSLAITCAFATTFLLNIIHFRPNDKFACLLEKVGKTFFAIAFFLAVIIPSPLWLKIVDGGVILFFASVVVFKYRQSSCQKKDE